MVRIQIFFVARWMKRKIRIEKSDKKWGASNTIVPSRESAL
jgi:hypothetical protein